MPNQPDGIIDKVFFLIAFAVMAFVAIKPDSFIKGITLGRSSSTDVSYAVLRTTQVIAGVAAISIAISLVVGLVAKK